VAHFDFIEVALPPSERSLANTMVNAYRTLQGY